MKNYEYENDYVTCPICGKKYSRLNNSHFATHNTNTEEILRKYPNTRLYSNTLLKKLGAARKHAWDICPQEKRKEIGMRATEKVREIARTMSEDEKKIRYQKVAKSLKRYYKDMDKDKKKAFYSKVSRSISAWWNNLSDDEKQDMLDKSLYKAKPYLKGKTLITQHEINGVTYKFKSEPEYFLALYFEQHNICWQYEKIKIHYLDTNGKEHIYITDFYLPDYNILIEFKGKNFYDKVNDKLKIEAAKQKGYITYIIFYEKSIENIYSKLDEILFEIQSR